SVHGSSAGRFGDRGRSGLGAVLASFRWRMGERSSAPSIEVTALETVLRGGGTASEGRIGGTVMTGPLVVRPGLRWNAASGSDGIAPAIELSLLPRGFRNLPIDRGWFRTNLVA